MTPKQMVAKRMVEISGGQLTDCYAEIEVKNARIAELEAQAIGFRESIRKAALDSEHGHEILNLCWDSYFPEMPVNGVDPITSANDKGE